MFKNVLLFIVINTFLLFNTAITYAQAPIPGGQPCNLTNDKCDQARGYSCQPNANNPNAGPFCQKTQQAQPGNIGNVFGKITPPDALKGLVAKDPSGAEGLSIFLSNLIALFFSVAAIVLVFMLVWGAFDWLTSEGDKEKVASARNKIMNALIGLLLFAVAFAIFQVLGTFTGFTFFVGQK